LFKIFDREKKNYFKAFIGRPVLWGLSAGGESGVKNVIQLLKKEFDLAMALAGI